MSLAPLIDPVDDLSPAELTRYARQLALPEIGLAGQRRLKAARVLVLGAGGLGTPVLTALVAAGVGTVGLLDSDTVAESNLHRQTLYTPADLGALKVETAASVLRAQNPHVAVVPIAERITDENALALIDDYDIVIDGTDNFPTRAIAHDAAGLLGKPYIWGSALRLDGQATVFWSEPPEGSPFLLADLYPDYRTSVDDETCETAGVLGSVCVAIGGVLATEAVKLIVGFGEPLLGRLLVHDGTLGSWRTVPFSHDPARVVSVELMDEDGIALDAIVAHYMHPADSRRADTAAPRERPTAAMNPEISPQELHDLLEQRAKGEAKFVLVDIREPWEREIVAIDGSEFVPMGDLLSDEAKTVLPPDSNVILYCHHDGRSGQARDYLEGVGWESISHLTGGVHAWVRDIEPDKPRY
ncbi:ThiF family adenylyltransferase [Naasia lichenicola]|nr:ThiF family adenylyltransferase [Naasia lichenicola]